MGPLGYYLFGLLGIVIHVCAKIQGGECKGNGGVGGWLKKNALGIVLSLASYSAIFGMWAGHALDSMLGTLSMWLSPVIAYVADSIWGNLISVVGSKLPGTK